MFDVGVPRDVVGAASDSAYAILGVGMASLRMRRSVGGTTDELRRGKAGVRWTARDSANTSLASFPSSAAGCGPINRQHSGKEPCASLESELFTGVQGKPKARAFSAAFGGVSADHAQHSDSVLEQASTLPFQQRLIYAYPKCTIGSDVESGTASSAAYSRLFVVETISTIWSCLRTYDGSERLPFYRHGRISDETYALDSPKL
ncbi:hypothetical protein B0H17DRAFT_1126163 [Mycena rosella]|uniref:Uncharacterized protein n=1 Tax=Mycena rosella TaxID=1033263 RepID=A0AAD7GTZ7_MYCRO|nr:hypothetical protein B0H17DRAFT_1126163 [Mycena rosella]